MSFALFNACTPAHKTLISNPTMSDSTTFYYWSEKKTLTCSWMFIVTFPINRSHANPYIAFHTCWLTDGAHTHYMLYTYTALCKHKPGTASQKHRIVPTYDTMLHADPESEIKSRIRLWCHIDAIRRKQSISHTKADPAKSLWFTYIYSTFLASLIPQVPLSNITG